jgi:hypothetical protein
MYGEKLYLEQHRKETINQCTNHEEMSKEIKTNT